MFGNSTDLVMRRFVMRIAKSVYLFTGLCFLLLISLFFLPEIPREIGYYIGKVKHYVAGVPLGMALLIMTLELGKLCSGGRWKPSTGWAMFLLAMISTLVAVLTYFYVNYPTKSESVVDLEIGYQGEIAMRFIAIGFLLAFFLKFSAMILRQKLLEKIYIGVFLLVTGYLVWTVIEIGNI